MVSDDEWLILISCQSDSCCKDIMSMPTTVVLPAASATEEVAEKVEEKEALTALYRLATRRKAFVF